MRRWLSPLVLPFLLVVILLGLGLSILFAVVQWVLDEVFQSLHALAYGYRDPKRG